MGSKKRILVCGRNRRKRVDEGIDPYKMRCKYGERKKPICNPAERLQIGKEEGTSGYGGFGVSRKRTAASFF